MIVIITMSNHLKYFRGLDGCIFFKIFISSPGILYSYKYFKKKGWQVTSSVDKDKTPQNTQEFKNFVLDHLRRNVPIMVENVDWGGHWRIIIGYDTMGTDDITSSDVLIMADPYDTADHLQDGYVVVPAEKFFYMWFDSHLFAAGDRKQQWLAAEPPAGYEPLVDMKTPAQSAQ